MRRSRPVTRSGRPRPAVAHRGPGTVDLYAKVGSLTDARRAARCSAPRRDGPDVLAQMICARVLARSAYSQGARDRQFGRVLPRSGPRLRDPAMRRAELVDPLVCEAEMSLPAFHPGSRTRHDPRSSEP